MRMADMLAGEGQIDNWIVVQKDTSALLVLIVVAEVLRR